MRIAGTVVGLALLGLSGQIAAALPASVLDRPSTERSVESVASWRYHNNCGWQGGRWVVDLGAGRLVLCRPNRPGRNYVWREDGPRRGWYDRRERTWHFNKW